MNANALNILTLYLRTQTNTLRYIVRDPMPIKTRTKKIYQCDPEIPHKKRSPRGVGGAYRGLLNQISCLLYQIFFNFKIAGQGSPLFSLLSHPGQIGRPFHG